MSDRLLEKTLGHLAWLVGRDTQNPPKRIAESGVLEQVREALGASFRCEIWDAGEGSWSLFATRGAPKTLWNFHLDTVPAAAGWNGSPFALRVDGERVTGLGACDIKGAAAAMLVAAGETTGDAALLFTSDEEAGRGRCIAHFLAKRIPFAGVVVAEPTQGKATLAHRGIGTASGRFVGVAGHASRANAADESAVHEAVRWGFAALSHAEAAAPHRAQGGDALAGLRFNLGRIEGGEKPNVVAAEARVRFGVRPPPGEDARRVLEELEALAPHPERVHWETGFLGAALPAEADGSATLANAGASLARDLGLEVGPPVDFWTEAALFSAEGYPALVFGPGDIAQAHAVDEWVRTGDLAHATRTYARILAEAP